MIHWWFWVVVRVRLVQYVLSDTQNPTTYFLYQLHRIEFEQQLEIKIGSSVNGPHVGAET